MNIAQILTSSSNTNYVSLTSSWRLGDKYILTPRPQGGDAANALQSLVSTHLLEFTLTKTVDT